MESGLMGEFRDVDTCGNVCITCGDTCGDDVSIGIDVFLFEEVNGGVAGALAVHGADLRDVVQRNTHSDLVKSRQEKRRNK